LTYFALIHPPLATASPLSLHDALPILPFRRTAHGLVAPFVVNAVDVQIEPAGAHHGQDGREPARPVRRDVVDAGTGLGVELDGLDRKSTRLNSSHVKISYAVFCLKKKK